jgi:hypothetical protein
VIEKGEFMKRCILYYPHIYQISENWLRQALLYWDEIGSIVPQGYEEIQSYSSDLAYLKSEGEFRPFRTDDVQREDKSANFVNEIIDLTLSDEFQAKVGEESERVFNFQIFREKVHYNVFDFLQGAGLARKENSDWFLFELNTGLAYMSLLAKYLASKDVESSTICGTDFGAYEDLNFGAKSNSESIEGLKLKFLDLLPVPTDNVAFQDIIKFKRTRREELLTFRKVLLDFQDKLNKCEDVETASKTFADFSNEMELEQLKLRRLLGENKISVIAGTIETLGKVKATDWITGLLTSGLSLAVTFGINLSKYAIDKRNEHSELLHNSAFSYLHSAEQIGILQKHNS